MTSRTSDPYGLHETSEECTSGHKTMRAGRDGIRTPDQRRGWQLDAVFADQTRTEAARVGRTRHSWNTRPLDTQGATRVPRSAFTITTPSFDT
ncbi:hypothetical protein RHCRD62_10578 [Rhodococcus sp. RD6.2]|nr:hypothetical protein RHCRD62_10578 [Rhodococcus sp. RD6.2]